MLVVLLAAKAAAEIAERLQIPAVVGEIAAGVLIGPSALGLVQGDDVLRVLSELGVILLLLGVGLEMDLGELTAVGRASLAVATVGVILPFAGGVAVGSAFGMKPHQAVFVGAALTATSVGISARVFGDLRALGTAEARTVLGAAVADDVMGLVILTVVVRLVTTGSISLLTISGVVGVAVLFLVVTSGVGVRLMPRVFGVIARRSRSAGTLVAMALAFTLALSTLASAARLAPIVGAFVAGLSLTRSTAAERIRRELTPVSHLFVPVFFLQIGIDADLRRFMDGRVLAIAGGLFAVGVIGKVASGIAGARADRLAIGIGMIPRGEVGLIFASLGLRTNVLDERTYAALLLVVLATTLAPPPFLRRRLGALKARHIEARAATAAPPAGWLRVEHALGGGTISLNGEPPIACALEIGFHAALLGGEHRPSAELLDWLSSLPDEPLPWDAEARTWFHRLLESGGPRSWRFLALTGLLPRALPELAESLERRHRDPFELDPIAALQLPRLFAAQGHPVLAELENPDRVLLAAFILDATEDDGPAEPIARSITERLGLDSHDARAGTALVADAGLLAAAARRVDGLDEEPITQLAAHIGTSEQALALYVLTVATEDLDRAERARLDNAVDLLRSVLSRAAPSGATADLVERRREEAKRMATDDRVRDRIASAPRAYVLAESAPDLVRQCAFCEPLPGPREARVFVGPAAEGWRIEIVARDRIGLLAAETRVLADVGADIRDAVIATWADGCALGSFGARVATEPDVTVLQDAMVRALREPIAAAPAPDVSLEFDDEGSPWHTICVVQAPDRTGVLAAVTAAFAQARVNVVNAKVATAGGVAVDLFEVTDRRGKKLDTAAKDAVAAALFGRGPARRRLRLKRRDPPVWAK